MKKATKFLAMAMCLLLALSMIVGCSSKDDAPAGEEKTFTLTLVYGDGTSEDIEITTAKETLGDAMLEEGLILQEEYSTGMVNSVNGVVADYNVDESWWCVYGADGNSSNVGIADIEIEEGANYKMVYTIGFG